MKYEWKAIPEMNDERTGEPTSYFAETKVSILPFIWITKWRDGWHVETKYKVTDCFMTLKICKSLASAKRWATMYFNRYV